MSKETLVPTGAVHERLGVRTPRKLTVPGLVTTRTFNLIKLNAMGQTWLRRDQIIEVLRHEAEATDHPVLHRLVKVLEEGTS